MKDIIQSRRRFLQLGGIALAAVAVEGCTTTHLLTPTPIKLTVMSSGGFAAAYKLLMPLYEKNSGNQLLSVWGPSMGKSPEAIPARLARGEEADVIIMVGYALDKLIESGLVIANSKTHLANSRIGVVVKQGAPIPDISTEEGLRQALLKASSIAYSDSASGVYVENELFKKLGIEQVKSKAKKVQQIPVAERVAAGEFEIGFQQVSEILPVKGISFVGKIPESVQSVTAFSAGIAKNSSHPVEAAKLINFLANSAAAQQAIVASGMDLRQQ